MVSKVTGCELDDQGFLSLPSYPGHI